MFDTNKNSHGFGGFLASSKGRPLPGLENLEDRAVPAVIGGMVYQDSNFNGLFDPGENGITNTSVALHDVANNTIATATTDSTGHYQFTQRNVASTAPATSSYEAIFAASPTNLMRTQSVQQFDPTLGDLTSVDLIAQGSTTSHVVIENMDAQSATVKSELNADIKYNILGQTLEATPTATKQAMAAGFDGQADLHGASAADLGQITLDGTFAQTTLSNPSDLAAFIGTGSVPVAQNVSATVCTCGTGNLLAMANTQAQGSLKVVYHYTPSTVIGPGQYTVVETQPPGYADGLDTADNITPIPNSDHTDTIAVTIHSQNDQSPNNNFGETLAPVTPPPDTAPPQDNVPPITAPSKFFYMYDI